MTTSYLKSKSIGRLPLRHGFLLIAVALACFALSQTAQAVSPAPDGGYGGNNTAEGASALFRLTSGIDNNALGFQALFHNTSGNYNTAEGFLALFSNATGTFNTAIGAGALLANTVDNNTASGAGALLSNTTGSANTADGAFALFSNTTGASNTGSGYQALFSNQTGANVAYGYTALYHNTGNFPNTALGSQTLVYNTTGEKNTAIGYQALVFNTAGTRNTACGFQALYSNQVGFENTAYGQGALYHTTGFSNIAVGAAAGYNLTNSVSNIDIGNEGVAGESNTIRIGNNNDQTAIYLGGIAGQTVGAGGTTCYVDNDGKLGVYLSARRYKQDIQSMDKASEAILALKPVTFRYRQEIDPKGIPQFGLVAEEVAEVNPDLVVRDAKGEIYTVRYEAVNAMLLNEFLKEHRKVEEQDRRLEEQEATIAQLEKGMDVLTARRDEQDSQIQKVSAQIETSKPVAQAVVNNP